MKAPGVSRRISSARATAPPMPACAGVSSMRAPRALRSFRRSTDMEAGIVSTSE